MYYLTGEDEAQGKVDVKLILSLLCRRIPTDSPVRPVGIR